MKVTVSEPVEPTVTVSMTETEAKFLLGFLHCNFAGRGFHNSIAAQFGEALYDALDAGAPVADYSVYGDPKVRAGRVVSIPDTVARSAYLITMNGKQIGELK